MSYFPSGDPRTRRTNLRTWSGLRYQEVYLGIDLVYYGNRGQLEYDFVVGSSPSSTACPSRINQRSGGCLPRCQVRGCDAPHVVLRLMFLC